MERKEFLMRTAQLCLACGGGVFLAGQETKTGDDAGEKAKKTREAEKRFREAWVLTLMQNMEKQLDEASRVKLMEDCGRACARRSGILTLAKKYQGNIKGFLEAMAGELGKDNLGMDGDAIRWGYSRCYCELVADSSTLLPRTYCLCSAGWVREVFDALAQKPVRVELVQSIKQGASSCRFVIRA
jgi:hypothetical protein